MIDFLAIAVRLRDEVEPTIVKCMACNRCAVSWGSPECKICDGFGWIDLDAISIACAVQNAGEEL